MALTKVQSVMLVFLIIIVTVSGSVAYFLWSGQAESTKERVLFDAISNSVYFVYPDPNRMQRAVATFDTVSGSIIYGMFKNPQIQVFDNNPLVVSQNESDKGRLLLNKTVTLMFGSRNPNWCVKYLENNRLTPVFFKKDDTNIMFIDSDTEVVKVNRIFSSINFEHEDYFVIMTLVDLDGNFIFINYGFEWKGTWASGMHFKNIYPNIEGKPNVYYIFHWIDLDADGIPEPSEITQEVAG